MQRLGLIKKEEITEYDENLDPKQVWILGSGFY